MTHGTVYTFVGKVVNQLSSLGVSLIRLTVLKVHLFNQFDLVIKQSNTYFSVFYGQVTAAHTTCGNNSARLLTASMVTTNVLHEIWTSDKWMPQMLQIQKTNVPFSGQSPQIYSGITFDGTNWMEADTTNVAEGLEWCASNPTGNIISKSPIWKHQN